MGDKLNFVSDSGVPCQLIEKSTSRVEISTAVFTDLMAVTNITEFKFVFQLSAKKSIFLYM
jgi:hypothetical protein